MVEVSTNLSQVNLFNIIRNGTRNRGFFYKLLTCSSAHSMKNSKCLHTEIHTYFCITILWFIPTGYDCSLLWVQIRWRFWVSVYFNGLRVIFPLLSPCWLDSFLSILLIGLCSFTGSLGSDAWSISTCIWFWSCFLLFLLVHSRACKIMSNSYLLRDTDKTLKHTRQASTSTLTNMSIF